MQKSRLLNPKKKSHRSIPLFSNPHAKPLLKGIGIDLLSLTRARAFLRHHGGKKIRRIMSGSEIGKNFSFLSPARFARIFTAKEAFLKAAGRPCFGPEDFKNVEIEVLSHDRFRARHRMTRPGCCAEGEGAYFKSGPLIGAQIILWSRPEN